MAFLNAEMIENEPGKAVFKFRPTAEMENPFGTIQGGLLAGMIDNLVGPAVFAADPSRATATIQMNLHFLGPAAAGDVLIGRAEAVKMGRTQAYVEAELRRESDGKLLVKASAVNIFLDEKRG